MKKYEIAKLILIGLGILAMLIVIICSITIMIPAQRNTTAQKYDLECVAGRSKHPLQECKE